MKLSNKLKELRKQNNMTQDELAEKLFVTRTAISKWETDQGYPSIESLKLLSKLFNISIDELVSEEDIERKVEAEKKKRNANFLTAVIGLCLSIVLAIVTLITKIYPMWMFVCGFICVSMAYLQLSLKTERKLSKVKYIIVEIIIFIVMAVALAGFTYVSINF